MASSRYKMQLDEAGNFRLLERKPQMCSCLQVFNIEKKYFRQHNNLLSVPSSDVRPVIRYGIWIISGKISTGYGTGTYPVHP